jgi:hypothetical protein
MSLSQCAEGPESASGSRDLVSKAENSLRSQHHRIGLAPDLTPLLVDRVLDS